MSAQPSLKVELDYSLTGKNSELAIEMGLAEADWYQTPLPRKTIKGLLERKDGPALWDTALLLLILITTAFLTITLWGTWWVVIPYLVYAVFYATASDSRWHECSHGTAFKSDWMNSLVYEVASFMVMRESVVWRWSHTRHHSDTIIVGRDPEIQLQRPPNLKALFLSIFNLGVYRSYYTGLIGHVFGKITEAEKTFIPKTEFKKVIRNARVIAVIYLCVIISAILLKSWIPIFLFILPHFFGTWLMIVHNTTQHAGLAENVLDHRLNCRTVYMNPISRFIYWNMNYHLEHHMFPLVPYHALPKLHELIKHDCPPPYTSIYSAWKEIWPTLLKQVKNPYYHVKRELPETKVVAEGDDVFQATGRAGKNGWVKICQSNQIEIEDVVRFDYGNRTYAIYRNAEGGLYATDGICTHGNTHLSEGLVIGNTIECPKHNGRFNLKDGSPARPPVCRALSTYPVQSRNGDIYIYINEAEENNSLDLMGFRVLSNSNVSTFIKELVLEPITSMEGLDFTPGDYLQFEIPKYDVIEFEDFDIPEPFANTWRRHNLFNLKSAHEGSSRFNNYSIANNCLKEPVLKFNIRIATPPPGQKCPPGIGSSFMFGLKPGDTVNAIGPFGDFHLKSTEQELVYIGGGAGMAPIRSHISHLFENLTTTRKVSFWYGARSEQEVFYDDYFKYLKSEFDNFEFQIALSDERLEGEHWEGHRGYIHQIVYEKYLKDHQDIDNIEFYLCGPPMMIKACKKMLFELGVSKEKISFDEF